MMKVDKFHFPDMTTLSERQLDQMIRELEADLLAKAHFDNWSAGPVPFDEDPGVPVFPRS